jgi:folate-binding protein YgfZ
LYKHITVSGADAVEFLQGQLTQDVNKLERTGKLSAAWCNPKGRVICTLTLVQKPDSIGLLIPATIAEAVLKRLTMYRMRSAVEFIVDEAASNSASAEVDPRALIHAGIPTIDASNSEKFTPHMLNLDKLDAVSFTKGCYTGQEIVARTENLGKSKRRMHRYEADKDGIRVGDKLMLDDRNVGEVVNVVERDILAVTPVDSHATSLAHERALLNPVTLPYAF